MGTYGPPVLDNPEPQTPPAQKPTMIRPVVPVKEVVVERISPQIELKEGNPFDDLKGVSLRGVPRRSSKSAGQPPSTPSRRTGATVNSKSCPPARLKPSPTKEVIKYSGKPRREQLASTVGMNSEEHALRNKPSGFPLRRAGLDTSRKLNFFKKPSEQSLQVQIATQPADKADGDTFMIDVESMVAAEEIRKQAVAVEQVRDAGNKWLSRHPLAQRNAIEQLAVNFLLTMNSTLCFFTVAMRMLSKGPWTDAMISLDVRQAAIVAISRGWYVKCDGFSKYPFTRAELALAAGAYQGLLIPTIPDDTTVALCTIIDHLPSTCNSLFTQAEVSCPFCHAKRDGIVPTFSSSISWKDAEWIDLKSALAQAQPFLGYLPKGWHQNGCSRDDQCPKVTKLGRWLYLELRPYPALRDDFFPFLSESVTLFSDNSLCTDGLCVDSLVCSNLKAGASRHYWLVELSGGRVQHAYDSLQGVQLLTQELYRTLQVTGILLKADCGGKPRLRNARLDQLAGKVETVQRRSQAIKVPSRGRTCKMRKQLVKSMSKLSFAPTRINLLAKDIGGGNDDAVTHVRNSLDGNTPGYHKASGSQGKKKAPNKLRGCKTLKKGVISRTSTPGVVGNGHIAALHPGNEPLEGAAKAAGSCCHEVPHSKNEPQKQSVKVVSACVNAEEIDPISDSTPQADGPVASTLRVRKRSFSQAMLEDTPQCHGASEDDFRRKRGPPKLTPIIQGEDVSCPPTVGIEHPTSDVPSRTAGEPEGGQKPIGEDCSCTSEKESKTLLNLDSASRVTNLLKQCVVGVFSYQQILDIRAGIQMQ